MNKIAKSTVCLLFIIHYTLSISGCYSFTGSSVPVHLKTVSIPLFEDVSGFGEPNLREKLTRKIIDLLVSDNSLNVGERTTSDSMIEGSIVSVTDAPFVIAAGEQVTSRKVTLNIRASFTDMKFRKKVWEKDFSEWGVYAQGLQNRAKAIDDAINKIAEDILIETVSGW